MTTKEAIRMAENMIRAGKKLTALGLHTPGDVEALEIFEILLAEAKKNGEGAQSQGMSAEDKKKYKELNLATVGPAVSYFRGVFDDMGDDGFYIFADGSRYAPVLEEAAYTALAALERVELAALERVEQQLQDAVEEVGETE